MNKSDNVDRKDTMRLFSASLFTMLSEILFGSTAICKKKGLGCIFNLLVIKFITSILIFCSCLNSSALCQITFDAIPKKSMNLYRFDFARNFFSSPEDEKKERLRYITKLKELEQYKGKVATSANSMLEALQLYDSVLVQFMRHSTYFYLLYAVNTQDEQSRTENSMLYTDFSERTAFLQQELMQTDSGLFEKFQKQLPGLNIYSFYFKSAHRYQGYTLSLEEEGVLSFISPLVSEWQYDLYQNLLARGSYGPVITSSGKLDGRKDRRVISTDPDRSIREEGFRSFYSGLADQRDLYAFALLRLVESRNRLAQLRHFEDAPSAVYFESYWTKSEVSTLLEEIRQAADVYKRYERLRENYAKKRLGYSEVNIWDVNAKLPGDTIPRFTIEQANDIIRGALSPLGQEYTNELKQLLDPANGRMDIVPGNNRKGGGFSKGFPGVPTVFFSSGFTGFYNDIRVLTHESGHAIHRQLMKNGRVRPVYADGPHYLFESFSIFNEFLLSDYLYSNTKENYKKRYFLEKFFEGKGMEMFAVGQEEALELAIYEGVRQGALQNADDLDTLAKNINSMFSIWSDKHDELKMNWITSSLFYEDPLYDINYVYGSLIGLKYYEMYTRNPKDFIPRYMALLKNGFDAPPAELLKQFLGMDIHDPNLVNDAVRLLESKISLLEIEYAK